MVETDRNVNEEVQPVFFETEKSNLRDLELSDEFIPGTAYSSESSDGGSKCWVPFFPPRPHSLVGI